MEYYLRVEGVNLSNFVYDTNDLPTIRGGGLLLLDAIAGVKDKLDEITETVKGITQGASWGLFRFAPKPGENSTAVKKSIVDFLNGKSGTHEKLKHATFVVDVLPVDEKNFVQNINQLAALNHWQQMQAPSLAVPGPADEVCGFTKVWPASYTDKAGDDYMSKSVKARREYSKDQKRRDFYTERITDDTELLEFTSDFNELSSDKKQHELLHHKMAVIYIDGNKFGNFQSKYCKAENTLERFDISVREGQNSILNCIIKSALDDTTGCWNTDSGKIRLETLLWGGDEIIWVVPAWLGLTVLDTFYKQADKHITFVENRPVKLTKKQKRRAKKNATPKTTAITHHLKHAAGLVFCNYKAPIHRVINLAKDLAELSKKQTKDNLFSYQVLESFDHAGKNLEGWRRKRTENLGVPEGLFISPDDIDAIKNGIKNLRAQHSPEFPRRKMHQIIKALKDGNEETTKKLLDKLDKHEDIKDILNELKTKFKDSDVMWLHLVDLWEYAGEEL